MGVYLSTAKTDKASEDGEDDRLKFGASSMQGWRSTMEDAVLPDFTGSGSCKRRVNKLNTSLKKSAHAALLDLDTSTSFFGVYDGHGGKSVARFCGKYLHQQVLKQEAYLAGDLCTSVRKAFLRMDEMMCGQRGWRELAILGDRIDQFSGMIVGFLWSKNNEIKEGDTDDWHAEKGLYSDYRGPKCGCTACVAIIRNNLLVVANAGDSRCVISRNGQAYNLSKDHKPDLEIEKERIIKAGGYIQFGRVNGMLNLTRAIGDMELKQDNSLPPEEKIVTANPDIRTVNLDTDDEFIVLACDGIWDCMSSQQLVDFVRQQLTSEIKVSVVIERVFDRCIAPSAGGVGCDNMTMILVLFKESSYFRGLPKEQQPLPSDQQAEVVSTPSSEPAAHPGFLSRALTLIGGR